MKKCLSLVRLTTVFRIDSGVRSVVGQALLFSSTSLLRLRRGLVLRVPILYRR